MLGPRHRVAPSWLDSMPRWRVVLVERWRGGASDLLVGHALEAGAPRIALAAAAKGVAAVRLCMRLHHLRRREGLDGERRQLRPLATMTELARLCAAARVHAACSADEKRVRVASRDLPRRGRGRRS